MTIQATLVAVALGALLAGGCGRPPAAVTAAAPAEGRASYADGRFLFHERPTFVLGVYDSGLGFPLDGAAAERMLFARGGRRELSRLPGVNLYLNYQFGKMPLPAFLTLLDVLHRHGVMALATGNCHERGSWRRYGPGSFSIMDDAYVRYAARHPALFGYYVMDECRENVLDETCAHHRALKRADPAGLTAGVTLGRGYADPAPWVGALDVLMTDPYPLYGPEPPAGYPHYYVADQVARLRALVPPARPIAAVLQLFAFRPEWRLPTYAEMRSHAIMAIVEGARGLLWWEVGANGLRKRRPAEVDRAYEDLGRLTGELHALAPALLADERPELLAGNSTADGSAIDERIAQLRARLPALRTFNEADWRWYRAELEALESGDASRSFTLSRRGRVRTLVTSAGGRGFVFAYNGTNRPVDAVFTWREPVGGVSRGGERLALDGRRWRDRFGPYESHVYVVTAPARRRRRRPPG